MKIMQSSRERSAKESTSAVERECPGALPLQDIGLGNSTDTMTRDTVLASFSEKTWKPNPATLVDFGEQSHCAEIFRALRARLAQLQRDTPIKSLLVTSALGKEGRSFVALNLAQVMAIQPESRVLLVDGDLRNPNLHSILGTTCSPGLSEYLLQEADEFGIVQRGDSKNLFLITAGRSVGKPTELIANNRLKSLMDRLEPFFDWIIFDSPAAITVSDACLLANYCDGVLIVVRSHFTPFDLVQKARGRFREESLVGVILNESVVKNKPRFPRWRKNSKLGDSAISMSVHPQILGSPEST